MSSELVSRSGAVGPTIELRAMPHTTTRRWLMLLTFLLIASWVVGGAILYQHGLLGGRGANGQTAAPQPEEPRKPAGPPWGQLECVPIIISPPMEFVPEYAPLENREVVWHFSSMSTSRLGEYLGEAGVSEPLRNQLIGMAKLDPTVNGFEIRPLRDMVLGLGAEDRAKLYTALAAFAENFDQVKAFRFCGDSPDEWFRRSLIAEETRALVAPLVYKHDGYLFFADLRSIERQLASPEERLKLVKTLSRESTFLTRLKIDADADIDALVNYWGRGGRGKDVRPLLESLATVPGGEWIGITHLLPPFARRRIYTYPVPPERGPAVNYDCHWTAFNFFNDEPDNRFADEKEVVRTLETEYYRVYGNLQLGDMVMFFVDGSKAVHSAVYVADDILFTKNGSLASRPWMLIKLEDMKGYYPTIKPLEIRYYRKKNV